MSDQTNEPTEKKAPDATGVEPLNIPKFEGGIGNGWVIFTMLFIAFIALGIYLGADDECKGFMGVSDRDCEVQRTIDTLMGRRF